MENCIKCSQLAACRSQIVYPTLCNVGGLLVIGEAPGRDEDRSGEGFVGIAGKTLDRLLNTHGITRHDYGRANICRCRPPENRKPTPTEINACLPYLVELIIELKPNVVLTIGSTPTAIFCGKGSLYSIISRGLEKNSWHFSNYLDCAHELIKPILPNMKHIIPSPHTSPLAFNRNCPSGEKWGAIAAKQIAIAVKLNQC
ncbi:MAG: uracil-DNA glycosylase [Burkholderiales bacterium]|nr:uracil-DNA glycosylase [Burkholderiales bacterium]